MQHILKVKKRGGGGRWSNVGIKMTQFDRVYGKECTRDIRKYAHQEKVLGNIECKL